MTEQEQDVRDVLENAGHPLTLREVSLASGVALSTARGILRRMTAAEELLEVDGRVRLVGAPPPPAERRPRSTPGQHDEVVRAAVYEHAGESGLTITGVAGLVNLPRRVVENTLWRLETKTGDLVSLGRPRRYLPHPASSVGVTG